MAITEKYNLPAQYGDEAKKFRELFEKGSNRTTTGSTPFVSSTSGTTYNTTTGDAGIFNQISDTLEIYAIDKSWTDKIRLLFPDNAGAHNSIFRGKDLGTVVTTKQYADIANGSFEDMYVGDYWTIGGFVWRIACFNYYRNTGDSLVPGNHITLVPDTVLYSHVMNDTDITTGGYTGSKMYASGLDSAKTTIRNIFGSHLFKHRQIYSNATTDGKASGWAYIDSEVDLMNEIMVYGSTVWGESTIGGTGYNIGVGKSQLPLFALNPQSINTRQSYWLRDVVTASIFANVISDGNANINRASYARGVRPAFSIS